MVNIFARELTPDLAGLVKAIDKTVADNKDKKMYAFVVLLTDDPDSAAKELEAFAKKHGIENTPLTIFDNTAGPGSYKIAKDADVTVMLWRKTRVEANHAFAKGELNDEATKKIIADTSKILE